MGEDRPIISVQFQPAAAALPERRNAALIAMLVVCLDASVNGGEPDSIHITRLRERMDRLVLRAAFAGGDAFTPFRELAWETAQRLCAPGDGRHDAKWIKILREILRQLPECDALAS